MFHSHTHNTRVHTHGCVNPEVRGHVGLWRVSCSHNNSERVNMTQESAAWRGHTLCARYVKHTWWGPHAGGPEVERKR